MKLFLSAAPAAMVLACAAPAIADVAGPIPGGNASTITQTGTGARATINQPAANSTSIVTQSSTKDLAVVTQTGAIGVASEVTQSGDTNEAQIVQGDDGRAAPGLTKPVARSFVTQSG
ncbi:hypothetical protein [Novosphingobium sp.]|uniref:hypothetical protein n=1 Tax=Novosphingobium sp. TaxID=1874826 RepID=UPI0025F2365B|nr:hypothetical protein [Novosphingobium sp.]